MSSGPSLIRKPGTNRSNVELVSSLRDNFVAAQQAYARQPTANGGPRPPPSLAPADAWTERQGKTLYVPRIEWSAAGLREEPSQYEITVKLFLLHGTPVSERERYVTDAVDLVFHELGVQAIDLLIVSFPGMSFEGNCEWEADKINAQQGNLDEELATWKIFENLHAQGRARRLGVSEFGSEKLSAFIKRTSVPPVVDQINLKDCCNVPPPLKKLSVEQGIELNVHTDCVNILPSGTLRELLGHGPHGAALLADPAHGGDGLPGEILPQWVVRYLAFVRDRGVIENKGYFAGAELKAE